MSRRLLTVGLLLFSTLAGSSIAQGQDLADVIVDLIDQNFELGANEIAGAQHTFHFDEATVIANGVNTAIVQQLTSATPLSTTSGGVALEWDPEINSFARKSRDQGIEMLTELWTKRTRARARDQLVEIGELYGLALAWRGRTQDGQLAHDVLSEIQPLIDDPARRNTLRAVANLALQR